MRRSAIVLSTLALLGAGAAPASAASGPFDLRPLDDGCPGTVVAPTAPADSLRGLAGSGRIGQSGPMLYTDVFMQGLPLTSYDVVLVRSPILQPQDCTKTVVGQVRTTLTGSATWVKNLPLPGQDVDVWLELRPAGTPVLNAVGPSVTCYRSGACQPV